MDDDAIAFPGASREQQLALSQLMGLIVNATISEMEDVAHKIRDIAWRKQLDDYPVNPEMIALGEQFFEEEAKHSQLFRRYNDLFCEQAGVSPEDLQRVVPSAYGGPFQDAIIANAKWGGHAFWWVVAIVEEVALLLYQSIYRHRKEIDPLYYQVHRKHFEEESRHTHYAFLMLELIREKNKTRFQKIHNKIDLVFCDVFSSAWVIGELSKIKNVKSMQHQSEFFKILASCLPLMEKMSKRDLIKRLFVSAPYISLILNKNYHRLSIDAAFRHHAWRITYPKPQPLVTKVTGEASWKQNIA